MSRPDVLLEGSWRRSHSPYQAGRPIDSQEAASLPDAEVGSRTVPDSWRNMGGAGQKQEPHTGHRQTPAGWFARNSKTTLGAFGFIGTHGGPATPLPPLRINGFDESERITNNRDEHGLGAEDRLARPGQSPGQHGSSENWMLTPTSSLPSMMSLPGTPSRSQNGSPWPSSVNEEPHHHEGRDLAAKAVHRRHIEEHSTTSRPSPTDVSLDSNRRDGLHLGVRLGQPNSVSPHRGLSPHTRGGAHGYVPGKTMLEQTGALRGSFATASPSAGPAALQPSAPIFSLGRTLAPNPTGITGSPRRSPLSLASPPGTAMQAPPPHVPQALRNSSLSPGASPKAAPRALSPAGPLLDSTGQPGASISSVLSPRDSASRRGSVISNGSSSAANPAHSLLHSRKPSLVFSSADSPASSITSSQAPGIYRPPHARSRRSSQDLRPAVAHYDRVRTPSLRGQSRSRESSAGISSAASSRAPSTVPFSPDATIPEDKPAFLRRRLSSLSSFTSSVNEDADVTPAADADFQSKHEPLDTRSVMATLASTQRADSALEDEDDISLSGNDMMQNSITDGFCLSRRGSSVGDGPVIDIFEVGDRIGPGLNHDGQKIRIAETSEGFREQPGDVTGSQLEVVRKLGEGSYAVVYLVREVEPEEDAEAAFGPLDDGDLSTRSRSREMSGDDSRSISGDTLPTDDGDSTFVAEDQLSRTLTASNSAMRNVESSYFANHHRECTPVGGRQYALKCLCKRDLSEDMLEVQRLEATIHQSIPPHPYIVTLYRTYETADWLFLVLEYCPGQDLYYWLEQAQDTADSASCCDLATASAKLALSEAERGNNSDDFDATPPSPSLLATTAGNALLSRKRLRLVSRMFRQMCNAVQFCHDRGVSHRDLKPENFIVEDRRSLDFDGDASLGESMRDSEARVVVKLTDFGLATAQERCDDFDCGSKPYMAFECRNNVSESYDPRQADVWSLGVVLLNLLFHRNPFSEPSPERCESFASFCYDPVRFLTQSFEGLTHSAATFLSEKVFCEVSDGARTRVSAKELGAWAGDLINHLGLEEGTPYKMVTRGVSAATTPLCHSRTTSMSSLPSMMASPMPAAPIPLPIEEEVDDSPSPAACYSHQDATPVRQGSLSPVPLSALTPESLPSPTFSPGSGQADSLHQSMELPPDAASPTQSLATATQADFPKMEDIGADEITQTNKVDEGEGDIPPEDDEAPEPSEGGESNRPPGSTTSSNPKRRKRGARKARTAAKQELKRSQSVEQMSPTIDKGRDAVLAELAAASQTLARQMSKAMKERGPASPGLITTGQQTSPPSSLAPTSPAYRDQDPMSETSGDGRLLSSNASFVSGSSSSFTRYGFNDPVRRASLLSVGTRSTDISGTSDGASSSGSGCAAAAGSANWTSAASRRERMIAERKNGNGNTLQDSGRTQPAGGSWRQSNQSTTTLSSLASTNTRSSISTMSSATSSIYSTSSAPAAPSRKPDPNSRHPSSSRALLGIGTGLDTITEKVSRKEIDASYLAEIFGGSPKAHIRRRREEGGGHAHGHGHGHGHERHRERERDRDYSGPSSPRTPNSPQDPRHSRPSISPSEFAERAFGAMPASPSRSHGHKASGASSNVLSSPGSERTVHDAAAGVSTGAGKGKRRDRSETVVMSRKDASTSTNSLDLIEDLVEDQSRSHNIGGGAGAGTAPGISRTQSRRDSTATTKTTSSHETLRSDAHGPLGSGSNRPPSIISQDSMTDGASISAGIGATGSTHSGSNGGLNGSGGASASGGSVNGEKRKKSTNASGLSKFLHNVRNYNKGVKAAPGGPAAGMDGGSGAGARGDSG